MFAHAQRIVPHPQAVQKLQGVAARWRARVLVRFLRKWLGATLQDMAAWLRHGVDNANTAARVGVGARSSGRAGNGGHVAEGRRSRSTQKSRRQKMKRQHATKR